jgi:hypothetical protein
LAPRPGESQLATAIRYQREIIAYFRYLDRTIVAYYEGVRDG